MIVSTFRNYNTEETLKNTLVEPNAFVTIKFPNSISDEFMHDLLTGEGHIVPGCGCTSYKIEQEENGISFKVQAPDTSYMMSSAEQGHYLKKVSPYIENALGDKIQYDIRFYVRNPLV